MMRIISNFQERELLSHFEVPPSVLDREFDYLSPEDRESALFFKYKGYYYSLDQIMRTSDKMLTDKGWNGYHSDSYFSGILVSVNDNKVKVATYNS